MESIEFLLITSPATRTPSRAFGATFWYEPFCDGQGSCGDYEAEDECPVSEAYRCLQSEVSTRDRSK